MEKLRGRSALPPCPVTRFPLAVLLCMAFLSGRKRGARKWGWFSRFLGAWRVEGALRAALGTTDVGRSAESRFRFFLVSLFSLSFLFPFIPLKMSLHGSLGPTLLH